MIAFFEHRVRYIDVNENQYNRPRTLFPDSFKIPPRSRSRLWSQEQKRRKYSDPLAPSIQRNYNSISANTRNIALPAHRYCFLRLLFCRNYNRARQLNFAKARRRSSARERERRPSTVKFKAATFGKYRRPRTRTKARARARTAQTRR